jgi:hypothetical protein
VFVLPVSGEVVAFRDGAGADDLFLAEGSDADPRFRVEGVRRLAPPRDGAGWDALPYADVDAALVGLHRHRHGDVLPAEIACVACGERGGVSLSVRALLAASRPRLPAGTTRDAQGVFHADGLSFRVPSVRDVWSAGAESEPRAAAAALARVCAPDAGPLALKRIGALLDRIAVPLPRLMRGQCPQCGAALRGWLDPAALALAQLQARARGVLAHVHRLATRYGWSEEAILALPSRRRQAYVALIEGEGG